MTTLQTQSGDRFCCSIVWHIFDFFPVKQWFSTCGTWELSSWFFKVKHTFRGLSRPIIREIERIIISVVRQKRLRTPAVNDICVVKTKDEIFEHLKICLNNYPLNVLLAWTIYSFIFAAFTRFFGIPTRINQCSICLGGVRI